MKLLQPKFIILDELDSGLDVDSVKIVAKNVMQYKKDNPDTSILIITHLPKLLEYLKPDYVHVVIEGNIRATGGYELAKKIEEYGYNEYIDNEVNKSNLELRIDKDNKKILDDEGNLETDTSSFRANIIIGDKKDE